MQPRGVVFLDNVGRAAGVAALADLAARLGGDTETPLGMITNSQAIA